MLEIKKSHPVADGYRFWLKLSEFACLSPGHEKEPQLHT